MVWERETAPFFLMKVKITKSVLTVVGRFEAGSIVVLSDGTAEMLIREGFAEVPKPGKKKVDQKQEPKEELNHDENRSDARGAETASQS